jgi:hypothetical protein
VLSLSLLASQVLRRIPSSANEQGSSGGGREEGRWLALEASAFAGANQAIDLVAKFRSLNSGISVQRRERH